MKAAENETNAPAEQEKSTRRSRAGSEGSGEGMEQSGGEGSQDLSERFAKTTETIREETNALAESLGSAVQELSSYVEEQLQQRPYATLGVAAGIGYVLGGGLSLRFGRLLLGVSGRVASNVLMQQLVKSGIGQRF